MIFPGAGHAPDNAVTWFSDSGVMFGGCMVKGGDDLGFVGDVDRTSWPDAMRRLIALAPKLVVPGHGSRLDPEQLTRTLDLLQRGAPGIA